MSETQIVSREKVQMPCIVGVVEHGNTAILVSVTAAASLLDRRQVALTEKPLPTHPHHHEGSWAVGRYTNSPWAREISLSEALALVEKVRDSATKGAQRHLASLADDLEVPICGMALRQCPPMPPTVEACIRDNRAQSYADTVMYRQILANAALARGWAIYWYDRDQVWQQAEASLGCSDSRAFLKTMGQSLGPPWQLKHQLAAAAALAAAASWDQAAAQD